MDTSFTYELAKDILSSFCSRLPFHVIHFHAMAVEPSRAMQTPPQPPSFYAFDDVFCCDLPCSASSPCEPCWEPHVPEPCCTGDAALAVHAPCEVPHEFCSLPPEVHIPCHNIGCDDPSIAGCCDDPMCDDEDGDLCCDGAAVGCTTCCMADVCPTHNHAYADQSQHLDGCVPWHIPRTVGYGQIVCRDPVCASEHDIAPLLRAALQETHPPTPYQGSPVTTRSTPASETSSRPGTSRGGHRRLQGASVLSPSGAYLCHWTFPQPCALTFPSPKALHTHILATHLTGSHTHHPCAWKGCDSAPFATKPKLARHIHSHTTYKPYKCSYADCAAAFITQQQLSVHTKKHTGLKPFPCALCNKSFAYRDLLKSHLRSGVHGNPNKKYLCSVCGEGFSDSSNRAKHVKSVHDVELGVPCPEEGCGYVDTRREKLRSHCVAEGHGGMIVRNDGVWEEWFMREQAARRGRAKRNGSGPE